MRDDSHRVVAVVVVFVWFVRVFFGGGVVCFLYFSIALPRIFLG